MEANDTQRCNPHVWNYEAWLPSMASRIFGGDEYGEVYDSVGEFFLMHLGRDWTYSSPGRRQKRSR